MMQSTTKRRTVLLTSLPLRPALRVVVAAALVLLLAAGTARAWQSSPPALQPSWFGRDPCLAARRTFSVPPSIGLSSRSHSLPNPAAAVSGRRPIVRPSGTVATPTTPTQLPTTSCLQASTVPSDESTEGGNDDDAAAAAGLVPSSSVSSSQQSPPTGLLQRVKSYLTPPSSKKQKDGLTFKQRLAKMGLAAALSYGWVSNMSYSVTVSLAWYIHSKQVRTSSEIPCHDR